MFSLFHLSPLLCIHNTHVPIIYHTNTQYDNTIRYHTGGLLTTQIASDPAMLAGIMGFGTSALLLMVAEELLLETHEDDEHVWLGRCPTLYRFFFLGFHVDEIFTQIEHKYKI